MNPQLLRVTNRIIERSRETRSAYLARIEQAKTSTVHRSQLACGNLAHGFAACQPEDKASLKSMLRNNIAIITSYKRHRTESSPEIAFSHIFSLSRREGGQRIQLGRAGLIILFGKPYLISTEKFEIQKHCIMGCEQKLCPIYVHMLILYHLDKSLRQKRVQTVFDLIHQ